MNGRIETAFVATVATAPERKTSPGGKAWAAFNVRVGDGDNVQWLRISAFAEAAEIAMGLQKGTSCYIEGNLVLRTWRTEAGEQRAGLNVMANRLEALGQIGRRRQSRAPARTGPKTPSDDWQRPLDPPPGRRGCLDETIPF